MRSLLLAAVMIPGCVLAIDISFERDVLSVLTTKGCNSSGCHGSPAGQSGFKLSLYGADAAADYAMITSAQNGRRVDRANPANSLLLRKPSFAVAHGGGHLLTPESDEYRTLLGWLEQGARRSAAGPGIVSIALA
ncbi:MAG: cell surface protein, partial [Acidobacteriota bacterium]